jgi:hypothetical protein
MTLQNVSKVEKIHDMERGEIIHIVLDKGKETEQHIYLKVDDLEKFES